MSCLESVFAKMFMQDKPILQHIANFWLLHCNYIQPTIEPRFTLLFVNPVPAPFPR